MIEEDYVSYETAKLLKEKGFDERVNSYFTDDGLEGYMFGISRKSNSELEECFYSRPTLQMVMKWLRESHEIFILIEYDPPVFSADIYRMNDVDEHGGARHISPTFANHKSYEEACEAAINYGLKNLI